MLQVDILFLPRLTGNRAQIALGFTGSRAGFGHADIYNPVTCRLAKQQKIKTELYKMREILAICKVIKKPIHLKIL